jgi:hypothetical protein
MELASATSNLAVSLTAILLVSGIHNNGMELVLTTQRPTSQNHSMKTHKKTVFTTFFVTVGDHKTPKP